MLPHSLKALDCSNCPLLTTLPELPQSLAHLVCYNCPLLTTLPELQQSLEGLLCSNCPLLTTIPELPQSLTWLDCDNCPNLIFIPESALKYISSELLETINSNYLKWRQEQALNLFSSKTGLLYEDLIRKTWHPDRVVDWCWDTEEVKWFKLLK